MGNCFGNGFINEAGVPRDSVGNDILENEGIYDDDAENSNNAMLNSVEVVCSKFNGKIPAKRISEIVSRRMMSEEEVMALASYLIRLRLSRARQWKKLQKNSGWKPSLECIIEEE